MQNYSAGLFISIILHIILLLSLSDFLKIKIEDLSYPSFDPLKTYLIYEKPQNKIKSVQTVLESNKTDKGIKIPNEVFLKENNKVLREIKNEILSLPKSTEVLNNKTDMISFFSSIIQSQVMSKWKRPQSIDRNLKTEISIILVPTGEILEIKITKSSGNDAFDQSSITALEGVKKFEGLEMPNRLFDKHFRNFILIFNPSSL